MPSPRTVRKPRAGAGADGASLAQAKARRGATPRASPLWLELSIRVPFEFVEPAAELFRRFGKGGVAIEEAGGFNPDEGEAPPPRQSATIRTYIPQTPGYATHRARIHVGVALMGHITPLPPLQEREVREREWEEQWKAHFTPLRVGARLLVRPPWRQEPVRSGDVVVEIDPGLAFGTGHHPTTRMTLEALERLLTPGADIVDVGAGSGILSIAAAKLGAGSVVGIELDKIALKAGRSNVRANGLGRRVRLHAGTLPHPDLPAGSADLVVANINSVVLVRIAAALRALLRPGGVLVASGVLEERRASVEDAFAAARLRIDETLRDDDWVTFVARPA